jgi:hypothetical protein
MVFPKLSDETVSKIQSMVWRFVRVFLSSFLVSAAVLMTNVTKEDLANFDKWLLVVITAGLIGGISALGKFIRDEFPSISKLPL